MQRNQEEESSGKEKLWKINFPRSAKWPAAAPTEGASSLGDWGVLEMGEGTPLT